MISAQVSIGSRFSRICILLWLCLLIQSFEGGASASRADPSDVDQPRIKIFETNQLSESNQTLTLTPKSKRSPRFFAILKQYHDQLRGTVRYKDYELQQILIMSPRGSISPAEMNHVVTMQFFNFASSYQVAVEVTFEGGQVTSAHVPNDAGPNEGFTMPTACDIAYLELERRGPRALLKAPYMPLDLPSAFWEMELADFDGTLSDLSGRLLPNLYHNSQGIAHQDLDYSIHLFIQRDPRAFANLQWRVSDPTPCTFLFRTIGHKTISGALGMDNNGRIHLTEIAVFRYSNEALIRQWPLWLRRRQGPIPAWYGEVEEPWKVFSD